MRPSVKLFRKLIQLAKDNGYIFSPFSSVHTDSNTKNFLMRHDIDADLEAALHMAMVEAEMGVQSTYFLMLRSPVYNLLSRHNSDFVKKIIDLGHFIGVHYDGGYSPPSGLNLQNSVLEEAQVIGRSFNVSIEAVSFHQPSQEILNSNIHIDGLVNTYNHSQMKGYTYMSDSNADFRGKNPIETITNPSERKIQFLIHPMWWFYSFENYSSEMIWRYTLLNNWNKTQNQLLSTERVYGQKSIFEIDGVSSEMVDGKKVKGF